LTNVIDPPAITGAKTLATHSLYAAESPLSGQPHAVDRYVYTARLDDTHVVTGTSSASRSDSQATSEEAQQLLAKAVDIVRTR
jgi:Domain of unknown function (DUF5642)